MNKTAPVLRISNHGENPFHGWIRVAVDNPIDATEYKNGDDLFVPTADRMSVDVFTKVDDLAGVSLLVEGTPFEHAFPQLPDDVASFFGGPCCINGEPMHVASHGRDGAAWSAHLQARHGGAFVDVWLRWYPSQDAIVQAEVLVTASDPRSEQMYADTSGLTISFGDSLAIVGNTRLGLLCPGNLQDGQAQAFDVVFLWPTRLRSLPEWQTAMSIVHGKLGAVGIDELYPEHGGNPYVDVDTAIDFAVRNYEAVRTAMMSGRWPPIGPAANSGQSGEQEDQVFARGEAMRLPGCEIIARRAAYGMALRPCHHLEYDGTPVDPDQHPGLILWDGRPHQAGADLLGKLHTLDPWQASGIRGPDNEHWLIGTLASAHRLTRSPVLQKLLVHQAMIYLGQHTTTPGWFASQPGASRAIGWECIGVMMLRRELDDRELADRVLVRCHDRMVTIVLPWLQQRGRYWDVRRDDPRLGAGDWWMPWQQAVGAYGLHVFVAHHTAYNADTRALRRAVFDGALAVVNDAWLIDTSGAYTAPHLPVGGIAQGTDRSFNVFGMHLAVAVVLAHDPAHAKAQAIARWLTATVEPFDAKTLRWIPPAFPDGDGGRLVDHLRRRADTIRSMLGNPEGRRFA